MQNKRKDFIERLRHSEYIITGSLEKFEKAKNSENHATKKWIEIDKIKHLKVMIDQIVPPNRAVHIKDDVMVQIINL